MTNVKEGTARITDSTSKIQAEEGILVELKTVIKVSQESRVEKRWISQFGILEESRPISMAPCAKTRTNGVFGILLSQDVSKGCVGEIRPG